MIVAIVALGTVVVEQTKTAAERVDSYFTDENGQTGQTDADRDVDRLQHWLDDHRLGGSTIQERGATGSSATSAGDDVGKYTTRSSTSLEGAAISIGKLLFSARS